MNPAMLAAAGLLLLLGGCATLERSPLATSGRDETVRLQLFLDGNNFGPGVIDGQNGEFTEKALARLNQARGLPAGARPDLSLVSPYGTYAVTADNIRRIGVMAIEPFDIEKQRSQPYTSLTELIAERFHTTQAFLRELNPGVNIDVLQPGAIVTVPNVSQPFEIENLPVTGIVRGRTATSDRRVLVDLNARMLEIRDGSSLIAAFPITPGSAEHPAPPGEWRITGITTFPWFRYDEGVLKRGERTETFFNLPPGPNGPVGILWAGLNRPGIGIHGSPNPETIGRAGSHGCIRLSNWDAAKFRLLVGPGSPVTIQ